MQRRFLSGFALSSALVLIFVLFFCIAPSAAQNAAKAQAMVDKAERSLQAFLDDPNMGWFQKNLKYTKGLLIMPTLVKAGFFFGGSGGNGVLFARDPTTNRWSGPVFIGMGSVSFGLQIGGEVAELVMMIMTRKGLESLYASNVKIGGSASAAAGPVGIGAEGATPLNMSADMISFVRAKGAFAGAVLDGALLKIHNGYNKAYYGLPIRPVQVFVTREFHNPGASAIRSRLQKASAR